VLEVGRVRYKPVSFKDIPGWHTDDHAAALVAFKQSINVLRDQYPQVQAPDGRAPRRYFEDEFQPHRVIHDDPQGFFTGYFEPILTGSRTRSERFSIPLLQRPVDLETVVDDSLRASSAQALTHVRRTTGGLEPYPDRRAIELGHLDAENLEICFLEDPIDAYFLHVQGSGIVELDSGERIRVSYAAKNGHPYTSVGKLLIDQGIFTPQQMSLQVLQTWLRAQPDGGRSMLWENKSYIFFEELGAANAVPAEGAKNIPLTPLRSLAVDASHHALGLPIFIDVAELSSPTGGSAFRQLMIAQDVGSAIRGPERADIFFGTGELPGKQAGSTKNAGTMFVLLPRLQA